MKLGQITLGEQLRSIFLIGALTMTLAHCAPSEQHETLYQPQSIGFQKVTLDTWIDIPEQEVEANFHTKFFRRALNKIPVVGNLVGKIFEFPLKAAFKLFPDLETEIFEALPEDEQWTDPEFLNRLQSVRIREGQLKITPLKPEKCKRKPKKRVCRKKLDLDEFLTEVTLVFLFPQKLENQEPLVIPMATSTWSEDFDPETSLLYFHVSDVDVKSLIAEFGLPTLKIVAKGKPPKYTLSLKGRVRLEVKANVSELR